MFQFSPNFRNLNERVSVQRQLPLRSIKARTARWLLALFAAFSGLLSAFAQSPTPGCLPYSTTYPCIYVANFGMDAKQGTDSTISVINATSNSVVDSISVANRNGSGAQGVVVTPNNAFAYVALQYRAAVAVINTSTNAVIATVPLSGAPSDLAMTPDGAFVWVAEPANCEGCIPLVEVINTKDNQVEHMVTGLDSPTAITFSLDGKTAYVADTCNQTACVDLVNTSDYTLKPSPVALNALGFFDKASIATTPDGSLVCVSVQVASNSDFPTYGVAFIRTSDQSVPPIVTFSQAPASNYGFGITRDGTLYVTTKSGIVLVNTGNQTLSGLVQFGDNIPTDIAVGPDGATVYATNSGAPNDSPPVPPNVSVIKGGLLIATITGVGNNPQGVAVMQSLPPTIVTQPSSQTIGANQPATLSVTATGTPPLTYQWYQGQSGDTSTPIAGATSSSYTTPAQTTTTSYWVAVSNLVTQALVATPLVTGTPSTTATIMPILHPPTCTLSLQGTGSFLTVAANANCTDPQQEPLVTTVDWSDGSTTGAIGGSLAVNKTYGAVQIVTPYLVTVTSMDTSELTGTTQAPLYLSPMMSAFAGQSASVAIQNVPVQSLAPGNYAKVSFSCTTVSDSNGHVLSAASLGISCSSTPSVITLNQPQSVTITIDTTGAATALGPASRPANWSYALLLPIPAFLLLGMRCRTALTRRPSIHTYIAVFAVAAMLSLSISCGGGFTAPKVTQTSGTPTGSYQVSVVDMLVGCQTTPCPNTGGFVQTTLIVPLTVSPTQ